MPWKVFIVNEHVRSNKLEVIDALRASTDCGGQVEVGNTTNGGKVSSFLDSVKHALPPGALR